jgi:hypothetical protein
MEVAVLHEDFKNLACLIFKQAIIRQNHCGTTTGF